MYWRVNGTDEKIWNITESFDSFQSSWTSAKLRPASGKIIFEIQGVFRIGAVTIEKYNITEGACADPEGTF